MECHRVLHVEIPEPKLPQEFGARGTPLIQSPDGCGKFGDGFLVYRCRVP